MINNKDFINYLEKKGIDFFVGVPDSLIKDLTSFINEDLDDSKYLITANEGNAIAVASGYNLATDKIPAVFMQNSGLGNCINPLTSLTNKEVYSIPMILLIGWRGDPDIADEPQHNLPGQILQNQLSLLNIPNFIIDQNTEHSEMIDKAIKEVNLIQSPVALIFKKNTFQKHITSKLINSSDEFTRRHAIETILFKSNQADIVLATTGKASRELYEIRKNSGNELRDFMSVGSMGHISSIALGLDLGRKDIEKNIICIDGDGSCIMHMGALAILGCNKSERMKYFLINNGAHDSVGGQETVGFKIDFIKIAEACNFENVFKCKNNDELKDVIESEAYKKSSTFIEVAVGIGESNNLIRPEATPIQNKETFKKFLRN